MSNFACEHCGRHQIDSHIGYVAGCAHYPPEHKRIVKVYCESGIGKARYKNGKWISTTGKEVSPIYWEEENKQC